MFLTIGIIFVKSLRNVYLCCERTINAMKKLLFAALAGFVAGTAIAGEVINTELYSAVLGETKPYTIYLPDGYGTGDERYPVLYLLHGAWGTDRDWTDKGALREIADLTISGGTAVPMIVVMPDARGTGPDYGGERMGYFNVPGWNYETFFFDELMPHIDATYRTIPDKKHRAVAGLSMGGGGTVVYAQRHPELWSSACSLSGLVGLSAERFTGDTSAFAQSVVVADPVEYLNNADEATLEDLRSVRWYADCGDDDFLADNNLAFYSAMKRNLIPLEYRMRDGSHNWTYWRTALPDVLRFCSIGFTR